MRSRGGGTSRLLGLAAPSRPQPGLFSARPRGVGWPASDGTPSLARCSLPRACRTSAIGATAGMPGILDKLPNGTLGRQRFDGQRRAGRLGNRRSPTCGACEPATHGSSSHSHEETAHQIAEASRVFPRPGPSGWTLSGIAAGETRTRTSVDLGRDHEEDLPLSGPNCDKPMGPAVPGYSGGGSTNGACSTRCRAAPHRRRSTGSPSA